MSTPCGGDSGDEAELIDRTRNCSGSGCGSSAAQNGRGCGAGGGGNGCENSAKQPLQGSFGSWVRRDAVASAAAATPDAATSLTVTQPPAATCRKCRTAPATLTVRQQEPLCNACLEAGVMQRVRFATKGSGLVQGGDHVALALSGGPASLALLYCMQQMRDEPGEGRAARGKVAFKLSVLHIEEQQQLAGSTGGAHGTNNTGDGVIAAAARRAQLCAAAAAAGCAEPPFVLPLHAAYASDKQLAELLKLQQQQQQPPSVVVPPHTGVHCPAEGQWDEATAAEQLSTLLSAVGDATGRADVAVHLRDTLLCRAAAALGAVRLLRGECCSRIAAAVLSEAAKGRGYSLPADVQLLDARRLALQQQGQQQQQQQELCVPWPVLVRPVREVTAKELSWLVGVHGIQPLLQQHDAGAAGHRGAGGSGSGGATTIDALAARFVAGMEAGLPASVYALLRTAGQLRPFHFNRLQSVPDAARAALPGLLHQQSMRQGTARSGAGSEQQQQQQEQAMEHTSSRLCKVCAAPLPLHGASCSDAGVQGQQLGLAGLTAPHSSQLCYSCNRQLLYTLKGSDGELGQGDGCCQARVELLRSLLPPGTLLNEEEQDAD